MVAYRSLGLLRLRLGLHFHHVLHVHHFRVPAVRRIRFRLHDLFALHHFWCAEPSFGQDVRKPRPALGANNRGRHWNRHGARAVYTVQIRPQGSGYEQERSEQSIEMVFLAIALYVNVPFTPRHNNGSVGFGLMF